MTTNTNCPNCGAPIDIHAEKCAYCDTPYVYISKQRSDQVMRDDLYKEAIKAMGIYSVNETRRMFGLREI